jgi:hypothetical protein
MSSGAMSVPMEEDSTSRKRTAQQLVPVKPKLHRSAESLPTVEITLTPSSSNHAPVSTFSVPTNNDYDILSDDDQDSTTQQTAQTPAPTKIKKERVPNITMGKSFKWSNVTTELQRAGIKQDQYQLKMTSIGIVVKLTTIKNYESFLKRCAELKISYFTHAVESTKPVRIVLLGLPEMPIGEIKEDLLQRGVVPDDIKMMKIKNVRYGDQANYILYFKKGQTTTNHLRQHVKAVNSIIVRWAYYDTKRHGPTQCRRCQMWGHGSSNCQLPANCVKCAGQHDSASCNVSSRGSKVPEDQLKCVNCGNKHSANFGGCVSRKQYEQTRPAKRAVTNNQRPQRRPAFDITKMNFPALSQHGAANNSSFRSNSMYVNPSQSYRDQTAGNFNFSKTNQNITNFKLNDINSQRSDSQPTGGSKDKFSAEELMSIMCDAIECFRQCETRADQIKFMCQMLPKYLNGY